MKYGKLRRAVSATSLPFILAISGTCIWAIPSGSVCTEYPSSEIVFVGTLTGLTGSPVGIAMKFEAPEWLAGESSGSVTILREPGSLCRDPDTPVVGERYLVIAVGPSSKGAYGCAELKRESAAATDIEYFRLAESGLTPTEVSGIVRITGGRPIKGAKVSLAGTEEQRELTSDKEGRFHTELQPGRYSVTATFPKGYEAEDCGWSTLIVKEHRCVQTAICARPETPTSKAVH